MKKAVCAVYDRKAAVYFNPFYSVNTLTAGRDFMTAVADPTTQLSRNPEDYSLYCVAEFYDDSGLFVPVNPPEFLLSGTSNADAFSKTGFVRDAEGSCGSADKF